MENQPPMGYKGASEQPLLCVYGRAMDRKRLKATLESPLLWIFGLIMLAAAVSFAPLPKAAEQAIDLDENAANGEESKVTTRVLSTFPVEVENSIFNNAAGEPFDFEWPGAGPGGFSSFLTPGPDVGTLWNWSSVSQIYSIDSTITFTPSGSLPVFGTRPPGVEIPDDGNDGVFQAPGKSIFPTQVTISDASLTASLITFFSPEETMATCGVQCVPGQCDLFLENQSGATVTVTAEQMDCCPEPHQIFCEEECTSYLTDASNCGGCDIQCGPEELCFDGLCACPGSETQCGAGCFDLAADPLNCGACGNACGIDELCFDGACACPGSETQCGTGCFDLANDPLNCGACGAGCGAEQFCSQGLCACFTAGLEICDSVCVDLQNDGGNCGACGTACDLDELCSEGSCVCTIGLTRCGEECLDVANDPLNCGACGNVCGIDEFCSGGACMCPEGLTQCGAGCLDLGSDPLNCGACGNACGIEELCFDGICACPGAETQCGTGCFDLSADPLNCGACGAECGVDQFCSQGACACSTVGLEICGGTCVDLQNDAGNCGACGNACGENAICTMGGCASCRPPQGTACNNQCVNIHTDPLNCGGCGNVCDFSDCPSEGQGTCSQGSSCVCASGGSGEPIRFNPRPTTKAPERATVSLPPREVVTRPISQDSIFGRQLVVEARRGGRRPVLDLDGVSTQASFAGGEPVIQSAPMTTQKAVPGARQATAADKDSGPDIRFRVYGPVPPPSQTSAEVAGPVEASVGSRLHPESRVDGPEPAASELTSGPRLGVNGPVRALSGWSAEPQSRTEGPIPPPAGPTVASRSIEGPRGNPAASRTEPPARAGSTAAIRSRSEGRSRPGGEPRPVTADRSRPARERQSVTEAAPALEIVEAPVCDLAPIEQVIPDGGMFVQAQTGGRFHKEVQTTVTLELNGQMIAQGPCPVLVPVTGADTSGVILSPTAVAAPDASGDNLLQPGEEQVGYFITVKNLGDSPCDDPLATLSSPPDQFNLNEVIFLNATSPYGDFPAYPGDGLPVEARTNEVAFSVTTLPEQGSDVGRPYVLSVQCSNLSEPVMMPIVLGVGSACNPLTDIDGETYDHLDGFQPPVNATLVAQGGPVNFSKGKFRLGSTIPLKLTLGCGDQILGAEQIDPNPEIVALEHETLGPLSTDGINGDNNANPNDPMFSCTDFVCEYQFRTDPLPIGKIIISVQMPDSRVFAAGVTILP